MTLAEILVQVRDNYTYDNDLAESLGASPTDAQLVPYVNWAIRSISRKIKQVNVYIPITLAADTSTYSLNGISTGVGISTTVASQVTRVHRVFIGNNVIRKPNGQTPGMWSYNEIERYNPSYRSQASGQPIAAAQFGNNLLLYPAPTSTVASGTGNYLVAEYLPAPMSASLTSASPDLPVELHEAVAYLAAIRIQAPNITEAESYQRLNLYNGFINEAIQEVKKQNEATIQDFGSTFGFAKPKWIRW
jgi:hypothetical protein